MKTLYDGDTFEVGGKTFRVTFESDYYCGYPWDNDDGCGIVRRSNKPHRDGHSDKHPNERPLNQPGRNEYQFYFDWRATMQKAKRYGWNAEPYDAPNPVLRAVQQNFDYLRDFLRGEWEYVVVTVTSVDDDNYSTSLGWVETYKNYHVEQAIELAEELNRQIIADAIKAKQSSRFHDAMECGV